MPSPARLSTAPRRNRPALLLCGLALLVALAPSSADAKRRKKKKRAAPVVETVAQDPTPALVAPAPAAAPAPVVVPAPATPAEATGAPPPGAPEALAPATPGASFFAPPPPSPLKSGRFMVNLRLGPAFGVVNSSTAFALMPEFAVAILPEYRGYLIVPLAFQFDGTQTSIHIPIGFQYDLAMPVKGLFLTPRVSLGYAAYVVGSAFFSNGVLTPEFGAKYVFRGRWNFGAEPLSIPILFGSTQGTIVYWRFQLYAGANF